MIRIYTPPPLESLPPHPLLAFRFGAQVWRGIFTEGLPQNFFEHEAQFEDGAKEADIILLPHNFNKPDAAQHAYITHWADEAQRFGKILCLFAFADGNDREHFDPRALILRLSTYRNTLGPRDIVVPTTAQDFGDIEPRRKTPLPTVSFCGQAGYKTAVQWVKYYIKVLRDTPHPERRLGVYWRRRMLDACRRSSVVRANFIVRRSFSGASRTIELNPAQARKEFVDNLRDSDFVIAPKGDGNYSNRFLEALSMGRIPVVPDTDIVLPLEKEIDYSKIMVRVPMRDVVRTPEYIRDFYNSLSDDEWVARQRLAREVFTKYLRQDSFFRNFFAQKHG